MSLPVVSYRREQHSSCSQTSYTLPLPDLGDVTAPPKKLPFPSSLSQVCLSSSGESVCVIQREGGSVLWSAGSAFVVCCLETASPLSCVPLPTSTTAANVPGLFFPWGGGGLAWGRCRVSDEIVPGPLAWDVGVREGFSKVGGGLSAVAVGLKSLGVDASSF